MRVGDNTNYNRLRVSIETDGTLTAREAFLKSIEIMIYQLKAIVDFKEPEEEIKEEKKSTRNATASASTENEGETKKTDDFTDVLKRVLIA